MSQRCYAITCCQKDQNMVSCSDFLGVSNCGIVSLSSPSEEHREYLLEDDLGEEDQCNCDAGKPH